MVVSAEQLRTPDPQMFIDAGALAAAWMPARHPKIGPIRAMAATAIKAFDRIASINLGADWSYDVTPGQLDLHDEEGWRVVLESARAFLTSSDGTAMKIFRRDLSRYASDLAPGFIRSLDAARARAREALVFVAAMVGEDDELDAQLDLIPAPPPPRGSRPSVAVEL